MKRLWTILGMTTALMSCRASQDGSSDSKNILSTDPRDADQMFNYFIMSPEEIKAKVSDPMVVFGALARNQALRSGTACQKMDALWTTIFETREPENALIPLGKDKPLLFGNSSAQRLWRAFTGFESGSEVAPESHKRLTHRYGTFAQLKFVVEDAYKDRYTGLFKGADCIIARFSSAVSPESAKGRFTPGFAAKFFVDGNHESLVLIAQQSFAGQGDDYNWLARPLSNRMSFENNVLAGIPGFSRFFQTVQKFVGATAGIKIQDPRELSIDHLAAMTESGQRVEAPKSPQLLYLLPGEVKAFPSEMHDYRQDFINLNSSMPKDAAAGLGKVTRGVRIADVYEADVFTTTPAKQGRRIGYFETKTIFVSSDAADRRVYFKHSIKPREAIDYPSDFPKALWNDTWFTRSCDIFGSAARDLDASRFDPTGETGSYVQNYVTERKCSLDALQKNFHF